jgi:hypothetical protein
LAVHNGVIRKKHRGFNQKLNRWINKAAINPAIRRHANNHRLAPGLGLIGQVTKSGLNPNITLSLWKLQYLAHQNPHSSCFQKPKHGHHQKPRGIKQLTVL